MGKKIDYILATTESVKTTILHFLETLHIYDLYGFYWLSGVAILLLILALLLRRNQTIMGLLLIMFLYVIFLGPPLIYIQIHNYLYGTKYNIDYVRQMKFAPVMVIRGTITNMGEENITKCKMHTYVLPPQEGFMKNLQFLYLIKPVDKRIFVMEKPIPKGETTDFKLRFTDFRYPKEINSSDIYIYRECWNEELSLDF